jgi:hypothetical protein
MYVMSHGPSGGNDGGTQREPMFAACIHCVGHGCSRTLNFHDISQRLRKASRWPCTDKNTSQHDPSILCWAVFFDVFCVNPSQPNHTSHVWGFSTRKCLVVSCDDAPGVRDHTLPWRRIHCVYSNSRVDLFLKSLSNYLTVWLSNYLF